MLVGLRNSLKQVTDDIKVVFEGSKLKQELSKKSFIKEDDFNLLEYLPYDRYKVETKIFSNKKTNGFILRIPAISDMGTNSVDSITQLISHDIPKDCTVQVINFASPYIEQLVNRWVLQGSREGVLGDLARRRAEAFLKQAHNVDTHKEYVLRDFEIYLCFSLPKSNNKSLKVIRDKVGRTLRNMGCEVIDIDPELLSGLLSKKLALELNPKAQTSNDLIVNDFLESETSSLEIHRDFVLSRGYDKSFKYLVFEVLEYPYDREIIDSINYVGDFKTGRGLPFPFWISFSFGLSDTQSSEAKIDRQRYIKTNQADPKVFTYAPKAAEEYEECHYVSQRISAGDKFGKGIMHVVARLHEETNTSDAIQMIIDHFHKQKFKLNHVKRDVSNVLIQTLPFGVAENWAALNKLKMVDTALTSSCINLLPIFADGQNYMDSLMMLVGRRGQVSFWDCFAGKSFSASIIGSMGSGKSVFLQEFAYSILRTGGQVVIIDDGESSANFCKIFGGDFVDFGDEEFCINPFSFFVQRGEDVNMDSYGVDFEEPFFDLVLTILCVVLNIDKTNTKGFEDGLYRQILAQTVNAVLKERGNQGGFADVYRILQDHEVFQASHEQQIASKMATALREYAIGKYAHIFNGKATLTMNSDLIVFEMSGLTFNDVLKASVLSTVAFFSYTKMINRSRVLSLVIDEASVTIAHPALKVFLSLISTQARKYRSNVVVASQYLTHFAPDRPTANALFVGSEWVILFTVEGKDCGVLEKELSMSAYQIRLARGLRTVKGEYSEFMIVNKISGVWRIQRLLIDSFSSRLYSSSADDVVVLEKLKKQGYSIMQAIELLNKREAEHV